MLQSFMHLLTCGVLCVLSLLLSAPVSQAQDSPKILSISGKAEILAAGIVSEAKPGFRLEPGQAVRLVGGGEIRVSAENGNVELVAANGAVVAYDGRVSERSSPWQEKQIQRVAVADGTAQFSVAVGRVDVRVVTGQPLRVVAPLVTASVRGTRFTMLVAKDGSSSMKTLRGSVETLGRSGEARMAGAGQGLSLSAASYGKFLRAKGVAIPAGGNWRSVDAVTLGKMDAQVFGDRFDDTSEGTQASSGSDGERGALDPILSNPDCNPMAGQEALTGGSGGPLLSLGSNTGGNSLMDGGTSVSDVGRGDILNPLPPPSNLTAIVTGVLSNIGFQNPPGSPLSNTDFMGSQGMFSFDVSLNSGRISNASMGANPSVSNNFSVSGGAGSMTGASSFSIKGFSGTSTVSGTPRGVDPTQTFLGGTVSPGGFNTVGSTVTGNYVNGGNSGFQVKGIHAVSNSIGIIHGDMSGQVTNIR
ncbi:MAG: FecR domain-containing protein [Desulfovibrio sp.]|jgi:hypothetical protein|nr:FecR domain-containing protein [Desulfovibrio sp.]